MINNGYLGADESSDDSEDEDGINGAHHHARNSSTGFYYTMMIILNNSSKYKSKLQEMEQKLQAAMIQYVDYKVVYIMDILIH